MDEWNEHYMHSSKNYKIKKGDFFWNKENLKRKHA